MFLPTGRKTYGESVGVQHEPDIEETTVTPCVEGITENRTPDMPHVNTELVSPPRQRVQSQICVTGEPFQHSILGDGGLASLRHCRESFAVPRIPCDTGRDLVF